MLDIDRIKMAMLASPASERARDRRRQLLATRLGMGQVSLSEVMLFMHYPVGTSFTGYTHKWSDSQWFMHNYRKLKVIIFGMFSDQKGRESTWCWVSLFSQVLFCHQLWSRNWLATLSKNNLPVSETIAGRRHNVQVLQTTQRALHGWYCPWH